MSGRVWGRPGSGCPDAVAADQVALEVTHVGFDGDTHRGVIEIHRSLADDVASFFAMAVELAFPIERVVRAAEFDYSDPAMMAANVSSGFNFRTVDGQTHLSMHALGMAFDVNPRLMPYVRRDAAGALTFDPPGSTYDPDVPGTLTADHPLVAHLIGLGWTWGGHWTLERDGCIDYQHFQLALSPTAKTKILSAYGL